jgi:hypothetical protein
VTVGFGTAAPAGAMIAARATSTAIRVAARTDMRSPISLGGSPARTGEMYEQQFGGGKLSDNRTAILAPTVAFSYAGSEAHAATG